MIVQYDAQAFSEAITPTPPSLPSLSIVARGTTRTPDQLSKKALLLKAEAEVETSRLAQIQDDEEAILTLLLADAA